MITEKRSKVNATIKKQFFGLIKQFFFWTDNSSCRYEIFSCRSGFCAHRKILH